MLQWPGYRDADGIVVEISKSITTENVFQNLGGLNGGTDGRFSIGQHEYGFEIVVESQRSSKGSAGIGSITKSEATNESDCLQLVFLICEDQFLPPETDIGFVKHQLEFGLFR